MDSWTASMAIPPSAEECSYRVSSSELGSTPSSSSTSGCISADDNNSDIKHIIPADCLLLLNSDASIPELEKAIAQLTELIFDTEQCSQERKWIVRHLVELRLRLQDKREAEIDPQHPLNISGGETTRVIMGHHFKPNFNKPNKSSGKVYCDHCTRVIWSIVQAWYVCDDCGFTCHHKCVSEIIRICAQVEFAEHPQYEMNICPEDGLQSQKFRCAECNLPITLAFQTSVIGCFGRTILNSAEISWNEARICDYNGKYYCPRCHWNTALPIPARVIHNWDLEPKRVCQASFQLLRLTFKRPLLPVTTLNSRLFGLVHELSVVQKQRDQLILMKRYLNNCRVASEKRLMSILGERIYMAQGCLSTDEPTVEVGGVQLYSMQDLIETECGVLPKFLQNIMDVFTKHIKSECELCYGRGHICELCNSDDILFPFDDGVVVCYKCSAVFHRICSTMRHNRCSRCERRAERAQRTQSDIICDGKCSPDCDCPINLVKIPNLELKLSEESVCKPKEKTIDGQVLKREKL